MEYKVHINSLENFKAWSGGLTTLNTVRERGRIGYLTIICEDIFCGDSPNGKTSNRWWLWFDSDEFSALTDDLLEAS